MKVITLQQANKTRFEDLSIALGSFDGLHLGHMALIDAVRQGSGQSAALTFDTLPANFFGEHRPLRLLTLDEKIAAFEKAGIDCLCIVHFDKKLAAVEPDGFETLLKDTFSPRRVVVGYNYTYGRDARGNANTLKNAGQRLGFEVCVIPPVILGGEPVSSTRIREHLKSGSVDRAASLLGYRYSLCGRVTRGRGIGGAKLGFPTANLTPPPEKVIPLRGVYGVSVQVDGGTFRGVCNIGVNPTVSDGSHESIEIHVLGLDDDLYGKTITVTFDKRIRDEMKFGSTEALRAQIERDIKSL